MPSVQHQLIKLSARNLNRAVEKDITQIESLRRLLDASVWPLSIPRQVEIKELKVAGRDAEWHMPKKAYPETVILFLHGGGYAVGSLETHRALSAKIALECRTRLLTIDYRLAPEHPFPAALEDGIHAYQWLLEQGVSSENIFMMGDSAGGGLVLSTLLTIQKLKLPVPAGAVLLCPWADLTFSGESAISCAEEDPIVTLPDVKDWAVAYAGDYELTHPMISPLFGNMEGMPPMLIQASDTEVLTDDAKRLEERLMEKDVQCELQLWEGLIHVWHLFWRYIPEAEEAISQISKFIQDHRADPGLLKRAVA